ncbi:uncharacterized protein LOC117107688 [Anneissia japonica]|uniref:uncharacterized protein LOC117107688 n=1 Tax=Anneissia japonica TaxID=1529436 RepID=UPI001425ACB6|nr:uncharacterized protein LOC117107688 [Anneissia japonica]
MGFSFFFTELSQSLLSDRMRAIRYVDDTLNRIAFRRTLKKDMPQQNLSLSDSPAEAIVSLSLVYRLPQPILASDETVERERSLLNKAMTKQYDSKTSCFLQTMDEVLSQSTLSGDEVLISERFTYLEMPFNWIPKYTAVFTRRTNLAEYCICLPGFFVRPSKVRKETGSEDIFYEENVPIPQLGLKYVGSIAKSLATGLINGVAGKLGLFIFENVFPPGVPNYFEAVYVEIQKIVKQELTQNTIDEVNGEINGIKQWVRNSYLAAKEGITGDPTDKKKRLTEMLEPRDAQIVTKVLGLLMTERYAKPGICVFMIAAGMHLTILQELAYVDPTVSFPESSHYCLSIKKYAASYANFAKSKAQSILNQRLSMIHSGEESRYDDITNMFLDIFWWRDDYTGERREYSRYEDSKGTTNPDADKQRDRDLANHRNSVYADLKNDMQDPETTADLWLKLVTYPLPGITD